MLHEIEFTTFNACRGWWLSLQLQIVRRRRRKAKDENEILNELLIFCNSKSDDTNRLNQIKGNSIKVHSKLKGRRYEAKVRKDLMCTDRVRNEKYVTASFNGHKFNDEFDLIVTENKIPNIDNLLKQYKKESKSRRSKKYY